MIPAYVAGVLTGVLASFLILAARIARAAHQFNQED